MEWWQICGLPVLGCGVLLVFGIAGLFAFRALCATVPYLRRRVDAFRVFAEEVGGTFERDSIDGAPKVTVPREGGALVVEYVFERRTSHTQVTVRGHGAPVRGAVKGVAGEAPPDTPEGVLSAASESLARLSPKHGARQFTVFDRIVYQVWVDPEEAGVRYRGWLRPDTFTATVLEAERQLRALAAEVARVEPPGASAQRA